MTQPPDHPAPTEPWTRWLASRWRHRQLLKIAGICTFVWLFFVGYFQLLRHPSAPPWPMPLTPLDAWIPYQPHAIWVYASLWVYVGVAPALLPSLAALLRYGAWAAALCLAGLGCFWLWPTAVPASFIPADSGEVAALALVRGLDAPGNACPSLHVASAVFSAAWIDRLFAAAKAPRWPRWLNWGWLAAIAWSTVALRQHVVLDVAAGAALGVVFAALSLRFGPSPGAPVARLRL